MKHFTLAEIEVMIADNTDGKRPHPARIGRILEQLRNAEVCAQAVNDRLSAWADNADILRRQKPDGLEADHYQNQANNYRALIDLLS